MTSISAMNTPPPYQRTAHGFHDNMSGSAEPHASRQAKTQHPLIHLITQIDNAVISLFLHPHNVPSGQSRTAHIRNVRRRVHIAVVLIIAVITLLVARPYIWSSPPGNGDETVFDPFTNRRSISKVKGVLKNKYVDGTSKMNNLDTQLYYPPNCPWGSQMCAKIIPSFIFAGGELCGSDYIYNTLSQHPQILNNLRPKGHSVFDSENYDGASAFESYLTKFPYLESDTIHKMTTKAGGRKLPILSGENAPHYLYQSHITAKRIRETLPNVKLIFVLRDPIDRAYAQYLEAGHDTKGISFETFMNVELQILRRCGHTSTQTGWTGFVQCHQGSEIRASWNMNIPLDKSELGRRAIDRAHVFDSLARGMYSNSLEPFIKHFPASQILVLRSESFLRNPSESFQRIARFLGIDEAAFAPQQFPRHWQLSENELFSDGYAKLQLDAADNLDTLVPPLGSHHHHHHYHGHGRGHVESHSRVPAMAMEDPGRSNTKPTKPNEAHANEADDSQATTTTTENDSKQEAKDLDLSTRYRLQKVFRSLNDRLISMFESKEKEFSGWEYDVDCG
ncbi:hypothetical protein VKS41_003928 [Umbelopsis sp. WA50703]